MAQLDLKELDGLNAELEQRIIAANQDKTLVKWNKLLPDILMADILMVGQFTGKADENGQRHLNILMLQKDNHTVIPFFTSPAYVRKVVLPEKTAFDVLKLNTVRFFQSVPRDASTVLNPLSDCGKVFSPFARKIFIAEYEDRLPPLPNEQF